MTRERKYSVLGKNVTSSILEDIPRPIAYKPSMFGLDDNLTGKQTRICIIDTGVPSHKDIISVFDSMNFIDNSKSVNDFVGHATMMAGIIGSFDKSSILGIAPESELVFSKVINNSGVCNYKSVVAAILWAIIKKVDIILLAIGSSSDYSVLHDAIKKARDHNITVIGAANLEKKELSYPASYDEVLSVGTESGFIKSKVKPDIVVPMNTYYTTYLKNNYIKTSGSSLAASLVAGLAALIIQKNMKSNVISSGDIKKELINLKFENAKL